MRKRSKWWWIGLSIVWGGSRAWTAETWTVAVDPSSHAVVEAMAGTAPMSHRTLSIGGVSGTLLQTVPMKYLMWHDLNSDTFLTANEIEEMTSAEKAVVNGAASIELARKSALTTEKTSNNLCVAELADIESRVNTIRDTRNTAIETTRSAFNASVDAAAGNVAAMKVLLKDLSDKTAQGLTAEENDLATLAKQTAKCLKARTDAGVGN